MKKILMHIASWLLFVVGTVMIIPIIVYHFQNPDLSGMMVFQMLWEEYLIAIILITLGGIGINK